MGGTQRAPFALGISLVLAGRSLFLLILPAKPPLPMSFLYRLHLSADKRCLECEFPGEGVLGAGNVDRHPRRKSRLECATLPVWRECMMGLDTFR